MPSDAGPTWRRLGDLLIRRRIELDHRYANRHVFTRERGVEDKYRIINDIEKGRRPNYEPQTIALLEAAYELVPGSILRAVDGGDLELLPGTPGSAAPALAVVQEDGTPDDTAARLFPGDELAQWIWREEDLPEARRALEIAAWRDFLKEQPASSNNVVIAVWKASLAQGDSPEERAALIDAVVGTRRGGATNPGAEIGSR